MAALAARGFRRNLGTGKSLSFVSASMHRSLARLIPFALPLAACAPFPHSITLSPQIEGTVAASGVALEGARVYVSTTPETPCSEESEFLRTTDRQGKFHLEPTRQLRWIYAPMVAPISVSFYTLCLAHGRSPTVAYRGLVAPYRENLPIVLSCDLERPRQLTLPDMSKIEAVCAPGGS